MKLSFWKSKTRQTKATKAHHQSLTDKNKIAILLKYFHEDRILARINLPTDPNDYNSAVLSVNKNAKTFELDELTPNSGNKKLTQVGSMHLQGQARGILINFDAKLQTSDYSDLALHVLHFPEAIDYLQRRSYYRAKIGAAHPMTLSTYHPESQRTIGGDITDFSIHGIGVLIAFTTALYPGDQLSNCHLRLPNGESIILDLEIRQVQRMVRSDRSKLGCRFIHLERNTRKKIERLVRRIERSTIRNRQK